MTSPQPELVVGPHRAFALSWASTVMIAIASVLAVLVFAWPLLVPEGSAVTNNTLAPMILVLIVPLVLVLVTSQIAAADSSAKSLAMLGVMTAVVAAVRPLGAGTAGIETVFFPLLLAARAYGAGFGFVLGSTGLLASALVTGGVGTWLPYQMLAASLFGVSVAVLPQVRGRLEVLLVAACACGWSFAYGWLMDFSSWPFMLGGESQLSWEPGAGALENLHRFALYNLATSMGWNLGRALTTAGLMLLVGGPLLAVLRRAGRQANFA